MICRFKFQVLSLSICPHLAKAFPFIITLKAILYQSLECQFPLSIEMLLMNLTTNYTFLNTILYSTYDLLLNISVKWMYSLRCFNQMSMGMFTSEVDFCVQRYHPIHLAKIYLYSTLSSFSSCIHV